MAARFDLGGPKYAHRGLWTKGGHPENSRAAFRDAAQGGYGMEYDVQLSSDDVPLLFHDETLVRMTGAAGKLRDHSAADLSALRLKDTAETIPTLNDLLSIWPRVKPLLTEIKVYKQDDPERIAHIVGQRIDAYAGPASLMSFSADCVAALPSTVMRGLLVYPEHEFGSDTFHAQLARAPQIGVDYICCWHGDAPFVSTFAKQQGMGLGVFTLRKPEDQRALYANTDMPGGIAAIFEGYDPALA